MYETCSRQVGDEKTLGRNHCRILGFQTGGVYNKQRASQG